MESVNRKIEKSALVKEFLFHSMCYVRNGNLLKSRVSDIRVKRIRINQGIGVFVFGGFVITKKHIRGHLLSFYSPGTSAIFVKNTFL